MSKSVINLEQPQPLEHRSISGERDHKGRFQSGNSYRWPAGQSGNSEGRRGSITGVIRRRMAETWPDDKQRRTTCEVIADVLIRKAAKGDMQAIRETLDRLEGRSPARVDVDLRHSERSKYESMVSLTLEVASGNSITLTRRQAIALLATRDKHILEVLLDEAEPDEC